MSVQRAVVLLGTREGWPGTDDLGEVETAVVLRSFNPPAASRPLTQAQRLSRGAWSQSALLSPSRCMFWTSWLGLKVKSALGGDLLL